MSLSSHSPTSRASRPSGLGPGYFRPALLFVLLLLGPGCALQKQPADYAFHNGAEPETIDPAIATGVPENRIMRELYEGLTRQHPRTLEPIPGVAEAWEVSPDGLVYTFYLREDARWSDGTPVTAEDFSWSWKRVLEPVMAADYSYQLWYIRNARAFNAGEISDWSQVGVKVLDDRILEVTLEAPTAFFLDLTSFYTLFPVNRRAVEAHGTYWTRPENLVNNGPYLVEEWKMRDHMRLRKNPTYWDADSVSLEVVDIIPSEMANTAFNFFTTGVVDWIEAQGIPLFIIEKAKQREEFHVAPYLGTYFYRYNVTRPPFDDWRVRHALNLAVDKGRITELITRRGEIPADTYVPPGMPGYDPPPGCREGADREEPDLTRPETLICRGHDPELARRLLAEAGYPNGDGFPATSLLYNTLEAHQQVAEAIQQQWKESLNIHVDLLNQEWKVYLNSQRELDYQVCRAGWIGDYSDPNTFLDMWITDGGNNNTGWSSARYDGWIAEAAETLDPKARMAVFSDAEEKLLTDLPILPIYFYTSIDYYDASQIGGLHQNILHAHPLKYLFLRNKGPDNFPMRARALEGKGTPLTREERVAVFGGPGRIEPEEARMLYPHLPVVTEARR